MLLLAMKKAFQCYVGVITLLWLRLLIQCLMTGILLKMRLNRGLPMPAVSFPGLKIGINSAVGWQRSVGMLLLTSFAGAAEQAIFEDFSTLEAKTETDTEDLHEIKEAIAKLKPAERELVFLKFYNEKSYEQISNVLGISSQAINGRLRRIKKKIAISLNGSFIEARK